MDCTRFTTLVRAFVRGELSPEQHRELMELCRLTAFGEALLHYLRCGRFPAGMAA